MRGRYMIKLAFRRLLFKRFNIALTWLGNKRVQCPLNPSEKEFIDDTLASKESFVSGWPNDEVILKLMHA